MAQDVCSKMAEDPFVLKEDGYLNADTDLSKIVYHPSLNVILICTRSGVVHVLDVNSGVVLQSSCLSAQNQSEVTCRYIPVQDRILFCDGQAIGVRSDYNGVLLLDTILQKPLNNTKEVVKLELLLSEAIIFKQSLIESKPMNGEAVLEHVSDKIQEAQQCTKKGIKAQKWNTVCLELPLDALRPAAIVAMSELLSKGKHTPELSVSSAVQERLSELAGETASAADLRAMASEAKRRETFTFWPHMDYKWALPDQMAQAGFYHQPNASGDDRAMCFACNVCLVCWERTDEPWSEHERHSPTCPFVAGEYTQNVPLSVTHATNPATSAVYRGTPAHTLGSSSVSGLFATANGDGLVSVFDVSGRVNRQQSFFVTHFDSHVLEKFTQDFGMPGWIDIQEVKTNVEKRISALAIVGPDRHALAKQSVNPPETTATNQRHKLRPSIICGLSLRCHTKKQQNATSVDVLNDQNKKGISIMDVEPGGQNEKSVLYLVVYDFTYNREQSVSENEGHSQSSESSNDRLEVGGNLFTNQHLPNSENWPDFYTEKSFPPISNDNQMDIVSLTSEELNYPETKDSEKLFDYYKMIKKELYQSLNPGDSEVIFFPPVLNPKPHSGPRALHVENSETDAGQAAGMFLPNDYSFLPSVPSETRSKSISDYISEIKNSKSNKHLNYSRSVQCVPVPVSYKRRRDLAISEILPTSDGGHIFVVLSSDSNCKCSVLLVYALDFVGKVVKLFEEPVLTKEWPPEEKPIEVSLLAPLERVHSQGQTRNEVEGSAMVVCADGGVRIVELNTLKTTSVAKLEGEKFVSAAYCNSLERLCASTEKGSLHFYSLNDQDNESAEDHEEDDSFFQPTDQPTTSAQTSDTCDNSLMHYIHEPTKCIPVAELRNFQSLCEFELLKAGYCAVIPACWNEMQQVQRQRRHPQGLQTDLETNSKTWRLQTDTTTWDEHIFELTLPSPACLGHVDVYFSLHASATVHNVEVTLLRQNTTSIGHRKDVKFAVDDGVSFDALQSVKNPVTTQEYLRAHNADILAGPVNIASCLDLTDQGGFVTLTSPKLFKSRIRTILLHIKAVAQKDEQRQPKKRQFETSSSTEGRKTEFYLGCDCLHELSVTIYTCKHSEITHERSLRSAMLESNVFVGNLLNTVIETENKEVQLLGLNTLIWIAAVRLTRNRSFNGEAPPQQLEFLKVVRGYFEGLVRNCLLLVGRSVAHKCVKFVTTCCSGAKDINESIPTGFNQCIQSALLEVLDSITQVHSAGSLQWLMVLLYKVSQTNQTTTTKKCIELLTKIANELNKRTNRYHLLLRSRYGLYGTPLEPELFDIEPPSPAKSSSTTLTYASVVAGDQPQTSEPHVIQSFNRDSLNPRDVMSTTNGDTKVRLFHLCLSKMIRGLLETVPLYFTCVAASDGTRIERAESGQYVSQNQHVVYTGAGGQSSGTKKENVDWSVNDINVQKMKWSVNGNNDDSVSTQGNNVFKMQKLPDGTVYLIENDDDLTQLINSEISSSKHTKVYPQPKSFKPEPVSSPTNQSLPWQQLLITPPLQVMVVERMHSGARRFVTIDFGQPILLTDILVPGCHDLVSLSIDLWLKSEDVDGFRLVVASDIGTRNLILCDLQPPPLCRFMKITTVGRYGMSTARCRIPLGYFYGHFIILPEDIPSQSQGMAQPTADLEKQLSAFSKLFEDVSCRYSLSCSKLKDLLNPYLNSDMTNASHLATYMNSKLAEKTKVNGDTAKIFMSYQEAVIYQIQLNIIRSVIQRIERSISGQLRPYVSNDIEEACSDKLRTIAEVLLDVVLSLDTTRDISLENCQGLFKGLCVPHNSTLQFLAATLLDRACSRKAFWGTFLAETLAQMFSTTYKSVFPQDKVFILLTYLCRKSPERSAVLDATLKVVAQTLAPLAQSRKSLLAVSVDLPLLGWLLMFLSLQLDLGRQSGGRWEWFVGEMSGRNGAEAGAGSSRRKVHQKRNWCPKYGNLDWTHKFMQGAQVQALSALSNHAASLTTKLEAAIKSQEYFLKKMRQVKEMKISDSDVPSGSNKSTGGKRRREQPEPSSEKPTSFVPPQYVDSTHCLAVAKALLTLVLAVDHSCSADLFLMSCKVIARLVSMSKVSLGQLMSEEQLLKLINLCIESELPWAPHALACLLQDILEVAKPAIIDNDSEMETDASAASPSTSWGNTDLLADVENICEPFLIELVPKPVVVHSNPSNGSANNNEELPLVYEYGESDLEEFLDDMLERGRTLLKKTNKNGPLQVTSGGSLAMDTRLEAGFENAPEISLKKLITYGVQNLIQNIHAVPPLSERELELPPWPPNLIYPWQVQPESPTSNNRMLFNCFDALFNDIQGQVPVNLEHILRLWLTLNEPSQSSNGNSNEKFDPSTIPSVAIGPEGIHSLISTIAWSPGLSLRTWCTALQVLTLACNLTPQNGQQQWGTTCGMAEHLVNHPDFVQMLNRLLSGAGLVYSDKGLAGPSLCKALHDFLVRLQMRCDVVSPNSRPGSLLKTILLKVVYQLVQPMGPLAVRQGPLDAQCKLLQSMVYLDYGNADLSIAMSILESAGLLVYSYVSSVDRIKCVNIGERLSPSSPTPNSLRGLFGPVLGNDSNKQDRPVSWDWLLITLLKLLGKLVQTPLPGSGEQAEAMDTEPPTSQTDESKAKQIQQDAVRPNPVIPCLADTVLQHHPSIIRFCQALATCKASSICMLADVSYQACFGDLGEPSSVGDAVFHVLNILAKKASRKELIMEPLLFFLSQTPQLSEPLLWFILQVLNTEDALRKFLAAGGVTILARSLVRSSNAANTVSHAGIISVVMQHFTGNIPRSDASTAIAASSASKKMQQASLENHLALINFAPFGTIRCHSGTAQPANVLIQGGAATHRRARTPQWSYHFYPEETHTELTVQLPSAILLREVHLQPHLSSLATCPSAVALEVSADGPSRLVPACPPLPTSGMTFIRLHLPIPEVVNCVQLRLYKPRDASNIGLSQIRLLGTSALGGNLRTQSMDLTDDESHCKYSLGWLRLLYHCFKLSSDIELSKQVVAAAADVTDLLSTCCGLLLVPTHIPALYLPDLEKVLCDLSLFNRDNGLSAIRMLLESKSSVTEPLGVIVNSGKVPMFLNSSGCQSACELLYQICSYQDEDTPYRVALILEWLQSVAEQALITQNTDNCSPVYVSAIASILWSANQSSIQYDLKSMVTEDLFWACFNLQSIADDSLKHALDALLCSLCHIRMELFPKLLHKFGITSLSSEQVNREKKSITDDTKQTYEEDSQCRNRYLKKELLELSFTSRQFETIALVSRSGTAIGQLLDSGLPKSLTSIILEFCSSKAKDESSLSEIRYVTDILKFFADLSDEKPMRDWLGSTEGSSFWFHLLKWLCDEPLLKKSSLQSEAYAQLEEICIKFLSKCCLCHPQNQGKLADVLCRVIKNNGNGISGFMRRVILQLLLENERIPVSIKADEALYKFPASSHGCFPIHPAYKQTHDRALLHLSTNTSIYEILEQHVLFSVNVKSDSPSTLDSRESTTRNDADSKQMSTYLMSIAAAATAKDKRTKDAKNQMTATPQSKKKRFASSSESISIDVIEGRTIVCDDLPDQPLPLCMTLAHVLRLIEANGVRNDWPCVHLTICSSKDDKSAAKTELNSSLFEHPFTSALQVFSSMGGLALLAEHLPTVYPETIRPPMPEKPPVERSDSDWVKVEGSDDTYEDIEIEAVASSSPKSTSCLSNIPPHSLTAFSLFLRLPGYAEVLLKDTKRALCLLRLVLGVTDDGEGGDIFLTPTADSLPTLPFKVLQHLYDSTPLSTDDGRVLRKTSINIGVVHLILACLGIFTHQTQNGGEKDSQKENKGKDKRIQYYWAKGTGYGTGSTQQCWNVEQALMKQRSEEEHVTVLLLVLASYINPKGEADEELAENVLPSTFHQLLSNSVLLPVLCSYLRNDSVLDMARHIPLYRAALQLLRAITASAQLVSLLLPQKNSSGPSVSSLLKNMRMCVDTYTSKLRFNSKLSNSKHSSSKIGEQLEEMERDEGLAMLMPDIQATADMVCTVTDKLIGLEQDSSGECSPEKPLATSLEERYLKVMKWLQFDTYEMITENPEGGYKFTVSYHFESNARTAGDQSRPARVKRLAQEAVTLATSLPLSYSSSVFVRCDLDRLDIMKVLITGPADTPYANGCFEFDVFFPPDYPQAPMLINLETTGHRSVRFNPNLYNDGKVCLSVLNTWHGRPEEKWNAQTSSFLQVLVSIQSLILVPEPYFNEPGYERSRGTSAGTQSSREYNADVCQSTVRWAMLEQITNPCPCFRDVIHAHFYLKRDEVVAQVENWIKEMENDVMEKRTTRAGGKRSPLSNLEIFKKVFHQLKERLNSLKPPDCIEAESKKEEDTDVDMEKIVNDVCN